MTMFVKPFKDFNGQVLPTMKSAQHFDISLHLTNDNLTCIANTTTNCRLSYHRDYTPLVMDMNPANIYGGQQVEYTTYGRNVIADIPTSEDPIKEMKIGSTLLDWSDFHTKEKTRPSGWWYKPWKGLSSPFQPAAKDITPTIRFIRGFAVSVPTGRKCNMAGDDCYNMRVHPRIDKITHKDGTTLATQGYLAGGQELIITGWDLEGTKAETQTSSASV